MPIHRILLEEFLEIIFFSEGLTRASLTLMEIFSKEELTTSRSSLFYWAAAHVFWKPHLKPSLNTFLCSFNPLVLALSSEGRSPSPVLCDSTSDYDNISLQSFLLLAK